MKNHEDNFDELHMENTENTDAGLAGAYNSAITVPDMWDRISAGFDAELENIKNEKLSQGKVKVNTGERRKHWMGLAAAALLICVVAIPLISSGIMRNKKTKTMDMTMADDSYGMEYGEVQSAAEENSDDVAESAAESYDSETNQAGIVAGDVYDDAAVSDGVDSDEVESAEADEQNIAEPFAFEVSGSISMEADRYILTVSAVLSSSDPDCTIHENDRLQLTGVEDKLNLKAGETVNYDTIRLDSLTPLAENADGQIKYTAELIEVY